MDRHTHYPFTTPPAVQSMQDYVNKVLSGGFAKENTAKYMGLLAPQSYADAKEHGWKPAPVTSGLLGEMMPGPDLPVGGLLGQIYKQLNHATDSAPFERFASNKVGSSTDSGALGKGFYFSTDPAVVGQGQKNAISDVDIKNPLEIKQPNWHTDKSRVLSEALGIEYPGLTPEWSEAVTKELQRRGHDGVILDYSPVKYMEKEIMALHPDAIDIVRWE